MPNVVGTMSGSGKVSVRRRVIQEILDSETTYIRHMQTLVDLFVVPLRDVIPSSSHAVIFSNIQQLVRCKPSPGVALYWLWGLSVVGFVHVVPLYSIRPAHSLF